LVGFIAPAVSYMAAFPKRRLLYGMPVVAPMLTAPSGVRGDLELRHRGTLLTEPHVLEVQLLSRGRKDIPSSAYDGNVPIRLDVGAMIIEVLQTNSEPSPLPAPRVTIDGTALEIGPALIGKRQKISITILAEGSSPQLNCQASLIDVHVKQLTPIEESPMLKVAPFALAVTLPAMGLTVLAADMGATVMALVALVVAVTGSLAGAAVGWWARFKGVR
jgi:hypothetical protein